MGANTPDGFAIQTYMVEFEVPGALDGVTPGPNIDFSESNDDPQQIFRPEVEGNLGLIDPDYLVTDESNDGARGNRWISVFWLDASTVGNAGAVLEVVDAVDGTPLTQENITNLVGLSRYYRRSGILVPQGSVLKISGFDAGAEPHRIRIHISYLTDDGLLFAQNVMCCFEQAGGAVETWEQVLKNGPASGGEDALMTGGSTFRLTPGSNIDFQDTFLINNDAQPTADNTFSSGALSARWLSTISRVSLAVAALGAGTSDPTFGANSVGRLSGVGYAIDATGIAQLEIANPVSPQQSAVRAEGIARADLAGSIARVYASGVGASAQGYVRAETADTAQIRATGSGSFASGYANAYGYDATILASGIGSYAGGYSKAYPGAGYGTTTIQATERGSWAFGHVAYKGEITASGRGGMASGYAIGGPFVQGYPGIIRATLAGAVAQGHAVGGIIESTGNGSFATGVSRTNLGGYGSARITARGDGSLAGGWCYPTGIIEAGYSAAYGPATFPAAFAWGATTGYGGLVGPTPPTVRALKHASVAIGFAQGPNALIEAYNVASIAFGSSVSYTTTSFAEIRTLADESGCFAGGHAGATGAYTARISSENDGSIAWGIAVGTTANAYLRSTENGSSAFGGARDGGQNISSGAASLTHGYAIGTYAGATAYLIASGDGAVAFGRPLANTADGAAIRALGDGSLAGGYATTNGQDGSIEAGGAGPGYAGKGAFAWGYVNGGTITATAPGARAQGNASGGRSITASGDGSLAHGLANGGAGEDIVASADGAAAFGHAYGGSITASARNAAQFGVGTNSVADSVRIGTAGIHFKGTAGAFGAASVGQFWIDNGNVYTYSGAAVKNLSNIT